MTQQEELAALRSLVEGQKRELEKKDRIIKEKDDWIEQQDERIERQDERIRQLDIQIENMLQVLLHARKKIFGPSTEAKGQIEGQLSLFESVQELAKDLGLEQKKITVRPYTRIPRQTGVRAEMLSGLPQEIEEYILRTTGAACAAVSSGS